MSPNARMSTVLHNALISNENVPSQPYRAQGAALSLEDAAFLGSLLSRLSTPTALAPLLHAYEAHRVPRATATFESAGLNRFTFHLADGPAQEARDRSMRRAMRVEMRAARARGIGVGLDGGGVGSMGSFGSSGTVSSEQADSASVRSADGVVYGERMKKERRNADNANQWADAAKNDAQYGYDAEEEADAWWAREGAVLVARLEREAGVYVGAAKEGKGGEKAKKKTFGSSYLKRIVGM